MYSDTSRPNQTNQAKGLDIQKLQTLVTGAFNQIDTHDKNIVLTLGITGNGKSTSINYLMGSKMQEEWLPGSLQATVSVAPGEKEYTKIGQGLVTSETLYSSVIDSPKDMNFSFCDCPGFEDTRGEEERICAAINNQLAIKASKEVKAVMVVIEFPAFTSTRAYGIRKILPMIEHLLENPEKHQNSVHFIITKTPPRMTKQRIVDSLVRMKNELSAASTLDNDSLRSLEALSFMIQNQNNIVLIDPLDNGESREDILGRLNNSVAIPKTGFRFPEQDSTRLSLNQIVTNIASNGLDLMKGISKTPKSIEQDQKDIEAKKNIETRVKSEKTEQEKRLGTRPSEADINREHEQTVTEQNQIITDRQNRISSLRTRNNSAQQEVNKLDTSDEVSYWKDSYNEHSVHGVVKKGIVKDGLISYSGIPLLRHSYEQHSHSTSMNIVGSNAEGNLKFNYKGPSEEYGWFTTTGYVEKRNHPSNKSSIQSYKNTISQNNTDISRFESDIANARTEISRSETNKTNSLQATREGTNLDKTIIQAKEEQIERMQVQIRELEGLKAKKEKVLADCKEKMVEPSKLSEFNFVKKVASVMLFDSPQVNQFVSKFEKAGNQYQAKEGKWFKFFSEKGVDPRENTSKNMDAKQTAPTHTI